MSSLNVIKCDKLTDRPTDKLTDGPTDRPMDGPTEVPTDGLTDGPTDGSTDRQSGKVACKVSRTRLKTDKVMTDQYRELQSAIGEKVRGWDQ